MIKFTGIGAALAVVMALAAAPAAAQDNRVYDHATNSWRDAGPAAQQRVLQQRRPSAEFQRQQVRIETGEKPGTIIVDSNRRLLYFVEGNGMATRYGVGVGKEGFGWSGNMTIGRKAEWPGWTPPAAMRARERKKGRILPAYMAGGPENPLGARALYLYRGGRDSIYRIHGTNQPWTIGQNMSSGCIRMMNEDVTHLYERAARGAKVVVIGPDGRGRDKIYADAGPVETRLFSGLFGG